jgi:hypothetical protein
MMLKLGLTQLPAASLSVYTLVIIIYIAHLIISFAQLRYPSMTFTLSLSPPLYK